MSFSMDDLQDRLKITTVVRVNKNQYRVCLEADLTSEETSQLVGIIELIKPTEEY